MNKYVNMYVFLIALVPCQFLYSKEIIKEEEKLVMKQDTAGQVTVETQQEREPAAIVPEEQIENQCAELITALASVWFGRGNQILYNIVDTYPHLIDGCRGVSPLHLATNMKLYDLMQGLINRGANVNNREGGISLLHGAVVNGDQEAVDLLVSNGADVNIRNDQKETPLLSALIFDHFDIAKLLIRSGADAGLSGKNSISPSGFALDEYSHYLDWVNTAQDRGMNPEIFMKRAKVWQEIVELMFEYGADIGACTYSERDCIDMSKQLPTNDPVRQLLEQKIKERPILQAFKKSKEDIARATALKEKKEELSVIYLPKEDLGEDLD